MRWFLLAPAVLLLATTPAFADGGRVLLHQDSGPFTVTLLAGPLSVGMADMSVLVQDRTSGEVLLDPVVDLTLSQPGVSPLQVRFERNNRPLRSAAVHFSRAGQWSVEIVVRRGRDVAQVQTECSVQPDHSRAALIWFFCLLPLVLIVAWFVVTFAGEGRPA